jgi:hypothetical protein
MGGPSFGHLLARLMSVTMLSYFGPRKAGQAPGSEGGLALPLLERHADVDLLQLLGRRLRAHLARGNRGGGRGSARLGRGRNPRPVQPDNLVRDLIERMAVREAHEEEHGRAAEDHDDQDERRHDVGDGFRRDRDLEILFGRLGGGGADADRSRGRSCGSGGSRGSGSRRRGGGRLRRFGLGRSRFGFDRRLRRSGRRSGRLSLRSAPGRRGGGCGGGGLGRLSGLGRVGRWSRRLRFRVRAFDVAHSSLTLRYEARIILPS